MGQTATAWRTRLRSELGSPPSSGVGSIADADLDNHVQAAIRRFSIDKARILYSDYAGNGATYDLAIPAAWVHGFSALRSIEYPQGERPPVFLDGAEIVLYPDDSSPTHVRLTQTTPTSGKTARAFFTVPWPMPTASASDDKIADTDFLPVVRLAGYLAAIQLAGAAAQDRDADIPGADQVDVAGEADEWRRLGKELLAFYERHVGTQKGPAPASRHIDWDAASTWIETGKRFLFRGRR